ncbi:MAG: DAK2 domain-containing protein [Clostridia bacterium]|nr:DAK2 domain-containing protein [Clostridia bacterium]
MATYRIDGTAFSKMMRGALRKISENEQKVNDLNVFPVPDGDTGTNMRLTVQHGISDAEGQQKLNAYLRAMADGMIINARGNSGVIVSNFFDGFARSLRRYETMSAASMAAALVHAYRQAYAGCRSPKEGTILTVAREGIEFIRPQLPRNCSFETLLGMYVSRLKVSLVNTPELLPCLKEAGVVDSGGMGLVLIFEGMLLYLNDPSYIDGVMPVPEERRNAAKVNLSAAAFNENTVFTFGYCMEFLLQLMKGPNYISSFNMASFNDDLERLGESVVVSKIGSRVKVHVHTFKPARVIELAQNYGEFVNFKLENMCVQHNSLLNEGKHEHSVEENSRQALEEPENFADVTGGGNQGTSGSPGENDLKFVAPEIDDEDLFKKRTTVLAVKDLYKICVANGEQASALLTECGADIIIDGGPTMNTSSGEFLDCFKSVFKNAPDASIIVFPNNPNIFFAAEQAVRLSGSDRIFIARASNQAACYFGIAADNPQLEVGERVKALSEMAENAATLSVLKATRNYGSNGIRCAEGDWIAISGNELTAVSPDDPGAVAALAVKNVPDFESRETAIIFTGATADPDVTERISEALEEACPDIEFNLVEGGQQTPDYIAAIV